MSPKLHPSGSGTRKLQYPDMVICIAICLVLTTTELSREPLWEITLRLQFTSNIDDEQKFRYDTLSIKS
jgi:hypothetical protein